MFSTNKLEYSDGSSLELLPDEIIKYTLNSEVQLFDPKNKPSFDNDKGEVVTEFTGLATDQNEICSIAKASFLPNAYSQLHFHQDRTEEYYIIKGSAKVMINGKEHILNPGDYLKILPKEQHQVFTAVQTLMLVKCSPSWIPEDFNLVVTAEPKQAPSFMR